MVTNSKKVLEALPDFEKFMQLAEQIKSLTVRKMKLENDIKTGESLAFTRVMTDPEFFVNGKPVSVSYFENAFKFAGINGALIDYRNTLADTIAELEAKKTEFEIYRQMHDLFKTLVYQERVNT
jgi:hypothetical protein